MDEAIEVLEKGLQHHPNYLSAKVALARCHLETGKPQEAAEVLRVVVQQDPTQLVANKLLVEAYVAMDEDRLAGKALDAYMALNRSDPEIEQLDQRIEAMRSDDYEDVEQTVESEPVENDREDEGGNWEAATDDAYRLGEEEVASAAPLASEAPAMRLRAMEPFPGLYSHRERHLWLQALSAAGLFPVAGAQESSAPVAVEEPEEEPQAVSELGPSIAVSASEPQDSPALSETEEPPERDETVTLGRLYLEQGHLDQAATIFRRVIDRDPANVVALNGLAEVDRRLHRAQEPMAQMAPLSPITPEEPVAHEQRPVPSLNERKIQHLQEYLARLRRGAGSHVS